MTPELKTACEVVFQEHKISAHPIKWNRDAFRGRISIGLSEMAKETLVQKNIILLPNKSKKVFTQLNPDVATADSFEEAEKMIGTKTQSTMSSPTPEARRIVGADAAPSTTVSVPIEPQLYVALQAAPEIYAASARWYMKPLFLYLVWPVCGAAGGAVISFLMNLIYKALF